MAVRLEVGKKYVDGFGTVHGPLVSSDTRMWPFSDGGLMSWSECGVFALDANSRLNLICEYSGDEPIVAEVMPSYLLHVYAPPESSQMLRLSPHLQIPADTPQRTTYGPVQLPEHIVAGLQDPERQQRMLAELVAEHGHKIVRVELERVN